jgi:hypothetical protein
MDAILPPACYPVTVSRRGRILAVKWGYNPNSSSLGVDVTFLLFGMAAVALFTPLIALLLRARRRPALPPAPGPPSQQGG